MLTETQFGFDVPSENISQHDFNIKKSNNIDLNNYIVTLPPIHVPHPQNQRKAAGTEAWLSEQEPSLLCCLKKSEF